MTENKPHYHGHRQRLREKFLRQNGEDFADYELLELFLTFIIPRRDVKPLAKNLLADFGSFSAVVTADIKDLTTHKGISDNAAIALKSIHAASVRCLKSKVLEKPILTDWTSLTDYCAAALAHEKTEQFRILFLDVKNRLIADERQQKGTVNHTPVYPREVVKRALELHASAIILVHNHPSGDPTPSRADIDMTKQIQKAASSLGIVLHDHLIVTKKDVLSFRTKGYL